MIVEETTTNKKKWRKDLRGIIFGRLRVIEESNKSPNKWGNAIWVCICECGKPVHVAGGHLTGGKTKSCGCLAKEGARKRMTTHGASRRKKGDEAAKKHMYIAWQSMKRRCRDTGNHLYGGRGVTYDPSWEKFEVFLEDMKQGWEKGLSLDRIDPHGNYCKDNCRWADAKTQARNKRTARKLRYKGEEKRLVEWCEILGIPYEETLSRLNRGYNVEDAFESLS